MKKYLFILVSLALALPAPTQAAPAAALKYPIAELGGCASKQACKKYCDIPKNMDACLDYAENKSLLNPSIINKARVAAKKILKGQTPGGCASREACNIYCQDDKNFAECFAFADKSGLLDDYGKKLLKASKEAGPGGCKIGTDECEKYCSKPGNYKECEQFAIKSGLMDPGDAWQFSGAKPSNEPFIQYPARIRQPLISCMQGKVGAARFDGLWRGTVQESPADTAALESCLEQVTKN